MDFLSGNELLELCSKYDTSISDIMCRRETSEGSQTAEEINRRMTKVIKIMRDAVSGPMHEPRTSIGGLIGGEAKKMISYQKKGHDLCGDIITNAIAYSMAVLETNSCMGLIVAAPTAGSAGVVPGVLLAASEYYKKTDEDLKNALLNASAVGYLLMRNASVSGADAGCQAEVGSAAAMAASGLTELLDGTPAQSFNAASLVISNLLGLICDPVAGLVECPCQSRNSIGVTAAITAARMSLSGIVFPIPFDEMADTMKRVGHMLPAQFRETALGGCAATPSGCSMSCKILGKKE